jgi:Cu-Zn family superoxide dismutase
MKTSLLFAVAAALALSGPVRAAGSIEFKVHLITAEGVGKSVGTITVKPAKDGVLLVTKLAGLPPGEHGFHLHEKASCEPADKDGTKTAGFAAGGHFDPVATKAHRGPGGGGHKGDLPKLVVSASGEAKAELAVAGLGLDDFKGKSMMVHAGGDNYSDQPQPLGGGGGRIACGVAK